MTSVVLSSLARPAPADALVFRALARAHPHAACALAFNSPFELLIATILSAQCTDQQVNRTTPALFARYPDATALAAAEVREVEILVHATGFYRAKARNIVATAQHLVAHHGREVPRRMADLVALPGVARKTANVVLGCAFGIAAGVVVDTHVRRVAGRLGLTTSLDPVRIEQDLMARAPKRLWVRLPLQIIAHGRATCVARRPRCEACALSALCPSSEAPPVSPRPRRGAARRAK